MPTRDHTPAGAPCWLDLQTTDAGVARTFYTQLFGWTALEAAAEFGGYFMFARDGVPVAGCMQADAQAPAPNVWSVYLAVDDAATTVEAVRQRGGQVVVPPMPVGDTGTMAFVIDTGGAGIGLWQPDQFPGVTVLGEAGAPGWFELMATDFDASLAFYREVFGWSTQAVGDDPARRYAMMVGTGGEGPLAGVMDAAGVLPEGTPPHWSVYLGVADIQVALDRVGELGGSVLRPAEDTPNGALATVADPLGAMFKLVAPNEQMPARG